MPNAKNIFIYDIFLSLIQSGIVPEDTMADNEMPNNEIFFLNKIKGINIYSLLMIGICATLCTIYFLLDLNFLLTLHMAAILSCMLNMWYLRLKKNIVVASHILVSTLFILLMLICLNLGGYKNPFIIWFFIIPIGSGFLINFKASLVYGVLSGGAIFFFFVTGGIFNFTVYRLPAEYIDGLYAMQLITMMVVIIILFYHFLKIHDITIERLHQSEKEFKEISIQATHASDTKSQFLANMSHEIRTPMNGILGAMHILLDMELSIEQRKYASMIFNSAKALLTIINDILDFSKIESGKIEFENINFDLRVAIESISELPSLQARQKGIDFILKIDPDVPSLLKGDPGRIRQILLNLIGNAIKFTDTGEVVLHVSLEKDEDMESTIRFSISDTGIGISEEKMEILFEPFVQAKNTAIKMYDGTGLGLSICKLLVENLNGKIGVFSEEFIGSTFWFMLPLEKMPPTEAISLQSDMSIENQNILIVSDHISASHTLKEQLASLGLKTFDASYNENTLNLIHHAQGQNHPFDCVLMDCHEGTVWAEVLGKAIKTNDKIKATHLVVVSANGEKGDAKRFEEAGFSAYLSRPITRDLLNKCLKKINAFKANNRIITRYSIAESTKQAIKILIAEDNNTNLVVIQGLLKKLGYNCDSAENGKEAIEKFEQGDYDIILMDCQMPVMDGFEATARIREMRENSNQPHIIAMTANAFKGAKEKCLEAGMDDYISKPIDPEELSDILERNIKYNAETAVESRPEVVSPEAALPSDEDRYILLSYDKETMLHRFGNDEELVKNILDTFRVEYSALIKNIKAAVKRNNMEEVGLLSHALKGSTSNVNAMVMTTAALELEEAARKNDDTQIPVMLKKIEDAFQQFEAEVLK